jgi:hypothetical protein
VPAKLHIRVRRGSEEPILASTDMQIGELGLATDSKHIFAFDGIAKHIVGRAMIDVLENRPTSGLPGRFYYASDAETLYLDVVSSWVEIKTKAVSSRAPIFMSMGS